VTAMMGCFSEEEDEQKLLSPAFYIFPFKHNANRPCSGHITNSKKRRESESSHLLLGI
jgi:hypothetical protein